MTINRAKYNIALAKAGLNSVRVAEAMNISKTRLSMILNQRNVSPEVIGRLARALGVDVVEIIEQQQEVTPNEIM